ncbi:MAG: CHAD domain-containing protein [Actinobacteria bacterium]|nr:CHAD domain-containing protein [Actinomycetota bacterium]
MAYRLDPTQPTATEVRRALAEQLGRAARELRVEGGPSAEGIHEVRKRIKKARSLLRLARADVGTGVARHANAELRRVGADLARQRDADALVEAVDRLLDHLADPDAEPALEPATADALGRVRTVLAERAEAVRAGDAIDPAVVRTAARTLEQLVTWLDRVPAHAEGWDALGPGLARSHRRGRAAFAALPDEPSAEQLHEWRKRVKDLWYQQRLLRRLWPDAQRPVIEAADRLADVLGQEHDLAALVDVLAAVDDHGAPSLAVDETDRDLVVAVADARRADLQAVARDLGTRLYADHERAWERRHGAWWGAASGGATA